MVDWLHCQKSQRRLMRGLWKFLPWWFHSSSWQIDSDSFQFSKFEFHCLHFNINKILSCEIRSYWTLHNLWLKLGSEYHLCVFMDSCQQVFSYLLQRKLIGRSERVASLPGTSCKVGVISLPGTCAPVASLEYEKKNQSDCVARVSGPLHKIPSNNPHKTSPTLCVLAAKKQHFYKKLWNVIGRKNSNIHSSLWVIPKLQVDEFDQTGCSAPNSF